MIVFLEENKLWIIVNTMAVNLPDTYPVYLDIHKVKEAESQRLIMDGIRDNLIPHVAEKKTTYEMWNTLKGLYEAKNENWIMALKETLQGTKMEKGEGVAYFLT